MKQKNFEKILISVIVPVYNVEKYVKECIKSLIQLNESGTIEIIIINDGSTDSSAIICNELKNNYSKYNIRYYEQENCGLSETRNRGISLAQGEYIAFLDADDMWKYDTISEMKKEIIENDNVDIFFFDAEVLDNIGDYPYKNRYLRHGKNETNVLSANKYFSQYYLNPYIVSSCLCLYKKNFLLKQKIKFVPKRYHEDILFSFQTILKANLVKYVDKIWYIRRIREKSITTQKVTEKHIEDRISSYEDAVLISKNIEFKNIEMSNTMCAFWVRATEYIVNSVKELGKNLSMAKSLCKSIFQFYQSVPNYFRGYTYYFGLYKIILYYKNEKNEIDNDFFCELFTEFGVETLNEFVKVLYEKMYLYKLEIVKKLPFYQNGKLIGIYGLGNHTEQLFTFYKQEIGNINSNILFIDSSKLSYETKFYDYDVINIKDVNDDCEIIIISSYYFQNEIKQKCIHLEERGIKIINIYEKEKLPLF